MTTIEIRQFPKSLGPVQVLERFSLEIIDPVCVVVLGPSGSGRLPCCALIAGLETPDGGEFYWMTACQPAGLGFCHPTGRNLGMVFQSPALWPHMTAAEKYPLRLARLTREEARNGQWTCWQSLHWMAYPKRYPHELSGGESPARWRWRAPWRPVPNCS